MEFKKRGYKVGIILIGFLFLISLTSAFTLDEEIPTSINLKCGESDNYEFGITSASTEEMEVKLGVQGYAHVNFIPYYYNGILKIHLSQTGSCLTDTKYFKFFIANQTVDSEVEYIIDVNVTEDLWELGSVTIKEGEKVTVGGLVDFSLLTAGEDNILFLIDGCDEIIDDFLNVGESVETICEDEKIKFFVESSYVDLDASRIQIYSSEPGYNLVKSESTAQSDGECELGLDTLGAKVKRGNIFAIKTINIKTNKVVSNVDVMILDQSGELSPINGLSSNTGFFNERLHEEYEQDLVVELSKEDCEPSTQVILFEKSYNDYLTDKENKANSKTLNITLEENYKSGKEYSFKVVNLLGESIDGAEVKFTNPLGDNEVKKSDSFGKVNFTFTPGTWKIQVGKSDYESSELMQIMVVSSQYTIVALVREKEVSYFKKGDKVIFELRDENDTIVPRTVLAQIGDDELRFVEGISEDFEFIENIELKILEGEGYEEVWMNLKKKSWGLKWLWWVTAIIFIIIVIIIIIIKLSRGKPRIPKTHPGEMGFSPNLANP